MYFLIESDLCLSLSFRTFAAFNALNSHLSLQFKPKARRNDRHHSFRSFIHKQNPILSSHIK
jgi:hypothetical protein